MSQSVAARVNERKIQMAAQEIIRRWPRMEADAGQAAQQEQDPTAGEAHLESEVSAIIRDYFPSKESP